MYITSLSLSSCLSAMLVGLSHWGVMQNKKANFLLVVGLIHLQNTRYP